ncbi:MAG: type II secretion system F family protein [Planctomycetota bacterium]
MDSAELRFLNNLSVLLECGRPLRTSLQNLRKDEPSEANRQAYDAMVAALDKTGDFTSVLSDFPQLCSRTSLALLRAARRTSTLTGVLPRLARLVRAKVEGEFDPRQRFLETWALMVETGFSVDEALSELGEEFCSGPLCEVAEGLRGAVRGGKSLAEGASRFPEVFSAASTDLLQYGEARDLAFALRAINRLL